MIYLLIANATVLLLFLILNAFTYADFKKYKPNAIRYYEDTTLLHRIHRVFMLVLAVLSLAAAVLCFAGVMFDSLRGFILLVFFLLCLLFGLFPFSKAMWLIDKNGIYAFRIRRHIPWSQVIQTGVKRAGIGKKKVYMTLQVKKQKGEALKQVYYGFPIKEEEVEEARQIIREFVHTLEKQKYYRKFREEQSVALKDRKFY